MIDAEVGVLTNAALLEIRKSISILKWLKRMIIEKPVSRRKNLLNRVNETSTVLNESLRATPLHRSF
uniref:Uncharacterized protein n=1 Tax=Romanomermis culicivorax TaxID=13658 RepID=A0A915KYD1_ROMCU